MRDNRRDPARVPLLRPFSGPAARAPYRCAACIGLPSSFSGKVERSSVALLTSSRTLTTQVDVPNGDGSLRPGLYVYVTLKVPRTGRNAVIPAEGLVFNQRGTQVAISRDDGTVEWRGVHIQRDLGTTIEIDQGLDGGEQIVLSPPVDLRDGQRMERQAPKQEGKPLKSAAR